MAQVRGPSCARRRSPESFVEKWQSEHSSCRSGRGRPRAIEGGAPATFSSLELMRAGEKTRPSSRSRGRWPPADRGWAIPRRMPRHAPHAHSPATDPQGVRRPGAVRLQGGGEPPQRREGPRRRAPRRRPAPPSRRATTPRGGARRWRSSRDRRRALATIRDPRPRTRQTTRPALKRRGGPQRPGRARASILAAFCVTRRHDPGGRARAARGDRVVAGERSQRRRALAPRSQERPDRRGPAPRARPLPPKW
jgi:hypothetical protein